MEKRLNPNRKIGGQSSFGYKWYEGELIPEPLEANIYALAFDFYLVNQRFGTTARALNKRGYRTRSGKEFKTESVRVLLKKPIAKGIHQVSVSACSEDGKQENSHLEKHVAPIVSTEVWDHVQAIIAGQKGKQTRPPTQDLFIGKIKCGSGSFMELPSKSSDYNCPTCSTLVSKDDLRSALESQIERLTLPDYETLNHLSKTSLQEIKIYPNTRLTDVERDIKKLYKLHSNDAITEEEFKRRYSGLDKRKKQLLSTLKEKESRPASLSFIDRWHSLSEPHKRILVENLVDEII